MTLKSTKTFLKTKKSTKTLKNKQKHNKK